MTPAEKKARDAVVRSASWWWKRLPPWVKEAITQRLVVNGTSGLGRSVARLLREEAKRKGVRRGK